MTINRSAEIERNTAETQIRVKIGLDGTGIASLDSGVPFLDHMLDQIARHGLIDLEISARGDLHIDAHHTVEDIGITLGQAFHKAINLVWRGIHGERSTGCGRDAQVRHERPGTISP